MPIPPPPTQSNAIVQGALDLITSAMRLIGTYSPGEAVNISEANDALMVLNQMIDAWNADRLSIYTTGSQDFPFVLNKQSYTLGPGGDFDTQRPSRIDGMSAILLFPDPTNPVEVPLAMWTWNEWQSQVPVKQTGSTFPLGCYDDGNFPLRTLNFWPIPVNQLNNVRIYSWQALGAPATLQSKLSYPPGYAEALRYNLAVRLAPEFGADLPPVVASIAVSSLATIKTMNAPVLDLRSDLVGDPAGYNWSADMFGNPYQ